MPLSVWCSHTYQRSGTHIHTQCALHFPPKPHCSDITTSVTPATSRGAPCPLLTQCHHLPLLMSGSTPCLNTDPLPQMGWWEFRVSSSKHIGKCCVSWPPLVPFTVHAQCASCWRAVVVTVVVVLRLLSRFLVARVSHEPTARWLIART